MARLARFFVHEVNVMIVGLVTVAAAPCNLHYVSLLHEVRVAREEVCAARLELIARRHPFLKDAGHAADTCTVLGVLGGDVPGQPRGWRARFSL